MPEGHTIHRLARDHTRALVGDRLQVSSPQGRFAAAPDLDGTTLERIDAHGKHLFYRFAAGRTVHVHLGLFGKFRRHDPPGPAPRETVRLRLAGPRAVVDLTGPTDCRVVTPPEEAAILDRLGPDPLRADADPDVVWARLHRRRTAIGAVLLDQKVVAGVGNVYRAEALFVHGIHPTTPASTLRRDQFDALWATLVAFLRQGVKDDRIITVDPKEIGRPRSRIRRGEALYVYKQHTCRRCGGPISWFDLGGRRAYACATCQPPRSSHQDLPVA